MVEEGLLERALRDTAGFAHAEDIVVDAVRDLVRDEVKAYIRAKLDENPDLKAEMKAAVTELMEAKAKEAYAFVKIAKASAKLGLELVPPKLREQLTRDLVSVFEKEIAALMQKNI